LRPLADSPSAVIWMLIYPGSKGSLRGLER
jgi:hypothetical protein